MNASYGMIVLSHLCTIQIKVLVKHITCIAGFIIFHGNKLEYPVYTKLVLFYSKK